MDIEQNLSPIHHIGNRETQELNENFVTDQVNPELIEDFSSLPALEKITHINPKVRAHYYSVILEEIERQGYPNDTELSAYIRSNGDMLMAETIVENQKLVLRICFKIEQIPLLDFLLDLSKKSFWYNFFDKFLSSSKGAVKDEAWRLFEILFSRSDKMAFASLGIEFLSKNNLKINKLILSIFNNKFESFDNWQNIVSQITPIIDKLLLNPNPELRSGAIMLLKHLSFTFSLDITKSMKNLKPATIEDIRAFLISKGSSTNGSGVIKGESSENIGRQKRGADLYKVSEPISIIAKFNDNWSEKVISLQKWLEKKEMIENFLKAADTPRLMTDNYSHIISLAKRLVADSNMQVQICGIRIFGALAKGLRQASRNYIRPNFSLLVSKFKDKKIAVLDALHSVITDCFYCLSVEEIYEEVKVFNTQRNKDIRINILRMAHNLFDYLTDREPTAETKILQSFVRCFGEVLNIYYDDPDIDVRKMTNEKVLHIQEVWRDSALWEQMIKMVEPSKIKSRDRLPATPSKSEIIPERIPDRNLSPMKVNKPQMSKITKSNEKRPHVQVTSGRSNSREVFFYSFKPNELTDEEAIANLRDIFGDDIICRLESQNSKLKIEGFGDLTRAILEMDSIRVDQRMIVSLCTTLRKELKDFKEANVLLVKEAFCILDRTLEKVECVDELFGYFSMLMTRKLGEPKFKTMIQNSLRCFKGKLPFHKMVNILLYGNDFFRNPKIIGEWLLLFLEYFDSDSTYMFGDIKRLLTAGLNNSNQSTRTSAVSFSKVIAPFLSLTQVKELIGEIENQTLAKQLTTELVPLIDEKQSFKLKTGNLFQTGLDEEIEPENNPKPKTKRDSSIVNGKSETAQNNPQKKLSGEMSRRKSCQSLQSVQDITSGLTKPDWKTRKDAVEIYIRYLENNPSAFSAININETFQNLSLRLQDSSRPVAVIAISGIRQLLDTHFTQLKPYHRILVNTFLEYLSDKNVI
jgi:hypothetical protein